MAIWNIDPDHSVAAFTVRHMLLCDVHGLLNSISGSIRFDPARPTEAMVEATLDVSKIHTGIAKRDEHLRSADFFDVAHFPTISFRSSRVETGGSGPVRVTGDLTIRGVTRPTTLEVRSAGPVKSPFGGETTMGFQATTTINRHDFGVSWNELMEGGAIVDSQVRITLNIEADLAE
ncbi:MAG TPA: YceI family protein [Geobacterales bacterium]|nr:YceI family protein [Geobacterales bacterium]